MDGIPLVFGFRENFSHDLQHTKALIANDEFYLIFKLIAPVAAQIDFIRINIRIPPTM